jgi:glycosyltransferase involved in cell wall biosynthesis
MNILYADLEREWRGGQAQAFLTVTGLRERGHEVELLAASGSPLEERCREAGVTVHAVSRFGLRPRAALRLKGLVASRRPDIVHINEAHALSAAWMAGAHRRAPLVISRRIGFPLKHNPVSRARFAALSRWIATSDEIARTLRDSGIPAEKISIVAEGVVLPPATPPGARERARARFGIREGEFLFGNVAVFVPEKGQHHLIGALPALRAAHPEARLLLAGDGECRAELEARTRRLGLEDAVIFAGFVRDVAEVYAALDVFVFPSEYEGLGTSLLVALASGLPVVSTRQGSLGEVIEHERTGLAARPDAGEFAAAMRRMIEDPALRERLGAEARREAERRFSVARMVEGTIALYRDVLGKRAR